MGRLNFTSTYAFSKLLVEQMLDDPNCLPGVAKAIVRPSLITSVAGAPYPGWVFRAPLLQLQYKQLQLQHKQLQCQYE